MCVVKSEDSLLLFCMVCVSLVSLENTFTRNTDRSRTSKSVLQGPLSPVKPSSRKCGKKATKSSSKSKSKNVTPSPSPALQPNSSPAANLPPPKAILPPLADPTLKFLDLVLQKCSLKPRH